MITSHYNKGSWAGCISLAIQCERFSRNLRTRVEVMLTLVDTNSKILFEQSFERILTIIFDFVSAFAF